MIRKLNLIGITSGVVLLTGCGTDDLRYMSQIERVEVVEDNNPDFAHNLYVEMVDRLRKDYNGGPRSMHLEQGLTLKCNIDESRGDLVSVLCGISKNRKFSFLTWETATAQYTYGTNNIEQLIAEEILEKIHSETDTHNNQITKNDSK